MVCEILVDFYNYHTYDDFPNFGSIYLYKVDLEKLQYGREKENHSPLNSSAHRTCMGACFEPGIMLNVQGDPQKKTCKQIILI